MSAVHSNLGSPYRSKEGTVAESATVTGIGLQRTDREEDQVPIDTIGVLYRGVG